MDSQNLKRWVGRFICKPVWNNVGTPVKLQPTIKVGLVQPSFPTCVETDLLQPNFKALSNTGTTAQPKNYNVGRIDREASLLKMDR